MFEKIRLFFTKYERLVSPVTLVTGFIFDNIMLRRIDAFFSNAVLISYLTISALSILLLNIHEHKRKADDKSTTLRVILIFMMQFCLGGLFSASLLFYSKSGSVTASWPFLLMILTYVLGNEFLRKNYILLGFQIGVFFTALFSFLIFFFPVVLGKMGDSIFILSGISSLMITGLFVYVLSWFAPGRLQKAAVIITLAIAGIFTTMNVLYFTNLIPPIPLVLREVGIYRSITKLPDGTYSVVGEKQKWFGLFASDPVLHISEGDPLYAFNAVFAPARLTTDIVHTWQRYDENTKSWTTTSRIALSIKGGREDGFRTFSAEGNIVPGLWRINVETPRGQLLGRMEFILATPSSGISLQTTTK